LDELWTISSRCGATKRRIGDARTLGLTGVARVVMAGHLKQRVGVRQPRSAFAGGWEMQQTGNDQAGYKRAQHGGGPEV
jgi:hypothetical protein